MLSPQLATAMKKAVGMGHESPPLEERIMILRHVRAAAPEEQEYIDTELMKHIAHINQ